MGGHPQLADGSAMSCAPVLFVICGAGLLPVGAAATADFDFRRVIGSCSPLNDCPASVNTVFSLKLS